MQISVAGLALIERFEGFVGHPYQDSVGVWTIGYGHTHGVTSESPNITQAEAVELLGVDVDSQYGAAVNATGIPLNQNQFDATTSFVYNLGPGVLESSSTFGSHLRARDWNGAANAMLGYDHAGGQELAGLLARRELERALFLSPVLKPLTPVQILTHGEQHLVNQYTAASKHPHFHAHELRELHVKLTTARKRVWVAAERGIDATNGKKVAPGWGLENRRARYALLSKLTDWKTT